MWSGNGVLNIVAFPELLHSGILMAMVIEWMRISEEKKSHFKGFIRKDLKKF